MRQLPLVALLAALVGLELVGSHSTSGAEAQVSWGDIKGQVVFGGPDLPAPRKLDVSNNKDKEHCLSKGEIFSDEWAINKDNKGVRWAVVMLVPDGDPNGKLAIHPDLKAVPKTDVEIDQPCCRFEPHLVALQKGQVIVAKNSAPIAHNLKWGGLRNPGDNKLIPSEGSLKIDNLKASPYPVLIECNIHPWMKGYAWVFDHPYFAVTDENGNFEIKKAPAGKCRLVVWHEVSGYRGGDKSGQPIEIKAGATTGVGKLEVK